MSLPILILAAGKSRRFGSADKRFAALPHGGVLVNALVRRSRKAGLDVSVVIDAGDDVSARIDAPCILSANASLGMGHSIADGLAHLRVSSSALGVLILPVDLPLLRIESLLAVAKKPEIRQYRHAGLCRAARSPSGLWSPFLAAIVRVAWRCWREVGINKSG
jgi:molybdenum cofactor cytidylyltransferase